MHVRARTFSSERLRLLFTEVHLPRVRVRVHARTRRNTVTSRMLDLQIWIWTRYLYVPPSSLRFPLVLSPLLALLHLLLPTGMYSYHI
jgi:hypothetical protein